MSSGDMREGEAGVPSDVDRLENTLRWILKHAPSVIFSYNLC
jgi:hypothetical protein